MTGASYVPVDTAHPDDRISFMLRDSGAVCILVTPETRERARSLTGIPVIDCTGMRPAAFPPVSIDPGSEAVVLYTSGTAGTPKGTSIPHLAVESYAESFVCASGLSEGEGVLFYHSFGFDVHIKYLFAPVLVGARSDILPEELRLDPVGIRDHVVAHGLDVLDLPTSVIKPFVRSVPDLPARMVVAGGEKLGAVDTVTSYALIDTYGPTEYTVEATHIDVSERTVPYSVGVPYPNTKTYILDREHRRVPYGAVGELYLSGYQLASGYINDPGKDVEAFLDNPFSDEPGFRRMYATGDYFRFLPDGTLGVIGRKDGQVKIRGNRVELTEVEACIRSMPGMADVTVQPIVSDDGTKELCAYIV